MILLIKAAIILGFIGLGLLLFWLLTTDVEQRLDDEEDDLHEFFS